MDENRASQLPPHAENIGRFGIFGMEKLEGNVQAATKTKDFQGVCVV